MGRITKVGLLLGATALTLSLAPAFGQTADEDRCQPIGGKVPPLCDAPNRDVTVRTTAGTNTEFDPAGTPAPEGFMISVDGQPVTGDRRMADKIRRTDLALEKADIQVTFDGLSVKPRLDLETLGDPQGYRTRRHRRIPECDELPRLPDARRDQDHRPRGARRAAHGGGGAGRSERAGAPDAARRRRSGGSAPGV